MFAKFLAGIFARKVIARVDTLAVGSVRKLDNQFIIVVGISDSGEVSFRYEADRTNTVYTGLAMWFA